MPPPTPLAIVICCAELQQAVAQLHAWGCLVLAEGIETEAQHGDGIALAQDWLYGKPGEWEHMLTA